MSEYEVNVKVNVDSTEVDETIDKIKQLAEAIEVVNGLMEELTNANTVNVTAEISMDGKDVAQGLHKSQLAKSLKTLDARKITVGELNVSRIVGKQ